jgi:hypothetical protein
MSTQKAKLQRALVVGIIGGVLFVVAGVGSQILAAIFETKLEPVYDVPGWIVAGGIVGAPFMLYALPTLIASGFSALRNSGLLAFIPGSWSNRK